MLISLSLFPSLSRPRSVASFRLSNIFPHIRKKWAKASLCESGRGDCATVAVAAALPEIRKKKHGFHKL